MSLAVLLRIVGTALHINLRRLTTWVFAAVFVLIVVLLYVGYMGFGGMTATGVRLAANSDYAVAAMLGAFSFFLMHFTATLCGDPVVKDVRLRTGALIWSSPLDRRSYVLGKFLGGYVSLLAIYAVFVVALVLGQFVPSDDIDLLPFRVGPYLRLALWFVLVPTFFVGAVSFAVGTLTGSMKLVYIVVTAFLIGFLMTLRLMPDEYSRWVAYLEPSGLVWLAEHVAKSRGSAWLNANPIEPDLGFLLNRAGIVLLGAAALGLTVARFEPSASRLEYGGEVRPGPAARFLSWIRGRGSREIEDRYRTWVGAGAIPRCEPAPRGVGLYLSHVGASIATELRLLLAERSLWIIVPMIMFLAGVDAATHVGPFRVPIYPVSSEFAQQMVPTLWILLAGTTIFYTGEVFHRDDSNGVRGIIYATPVAGSALLLGKLVAMVLLSVGMVALTVGTAMVSQAVQWKFLDGSWYFDALPYWHVGTRVLLPGILILCGLALAINVVVHGRYLAYFTLIMLGALYFYRLVFEGERGLLQNPLAASHWSYSDITGLDPFLERLALHDGWWLSLVAASFGLATWLLRRTGMPWWGHLAPARVRRAPHAALFTLAGLLAAGFFGLRILERQDLRGTRSEAEREALALEDLYLEHLEDPRLCYRSIDVEIELHPERRTLDVRGDLVLVNPDPRPVETAWFTVDPLYEIRRLELDAQAAPYQLDRGVVRISLERPLALGETTTLHLDWSGELNPGIPRSGGASSTFIEPSAVFLSSFGPEVLPSSGISPALWLLDARRRRAHGRDELELLRDRSSDPWVPSIFGADVPFDFRARIGAPADLTVVAAGELAGVETKGARSVWTWESDRPIRTFAILAARYHSRTWGDDEVYFHPAHTYNLETIHEALADGRDYFARSFGPYPHRALRIVEFPRLVTMAQAFPTIVPFSESIGFLTNFRDSDRHVDTTYFVTAHEVAHQWWGYAIHPGASLGAQVLSESLAEYSAMALIDEMRGEHELLTFVKKEEDMYLRSRDPDREVALADLAMEGSYIWYQKGALVLRMLERQIGRDRLTEALKSFVRRWRHREEDALPRSHPTLPDLLDELRQAHRGEDLAWFYEQWFESVLIPDVAITDASLRGGGGTWAVEFTATNLGEGRIPVRVEAVRGSWDLDRSKGDEAFRTSPALRIWIEPGQEVRGTVTADFEPEAVHVDRMHETIDFDRTNNRRGLDALEAAPASAPPASPAARQG